MTFQMTAERYALALYEVADAAGELDKVKKDMITINDLYTKLPEVRNYCLHAAISASDALKLVEITFAKSMESEKTLKTLNVMAENSRLSSLPFIADAFSVICAEKENRITVIAEFANPPEDSILAKIKQKMTEKTGKTVELSTIIDPTLLGGFKLKWGNRIIDNSALGRVKQLRRGLVS